MATLRDLKVKGWTFNTSVHTSGFIVDRCTVTYTDVDPVSFTAISDTFANASTGDFIDVYVTIDGNETLLFRGVVKEWRWEEGPDGVQMATLETEDRRARLLDTYVPQGMVVRGTIVDPITGKRTPNSTFLQVMRLLGALAGVTIDTTTYSPPDYVIGPTLSFSGRTPVGTAIARLLKVYQYTMIGRVDLIRVGLDTYAVKQRPLPPYPDGQVIPASAVRMRRYHRTYVPRILRTVVNGYGQHSPNLNARCAYDLSLGWAPHCTKPADIARLDPQVERTPFLHRDTQGRIIAEGYSEVTTWDTRLLSSRTVQTVHKYDKNDLDHAHAEEIDVLPSYDPFGLPTGETTTKWNSVDGTYMVSRKQYFYDDPALTDISPGGKFQANVRHGKPRITTETVESLYDTTGAVQDATSPRYGLPLLLSNAKAPTPRAGPGDFAQGSPLAGFGLQVVSFTREEKKSTDGGVSLKLYDQYVISGDSFTMVPAALYHDISAGQNTPTRVGGPTRTPNSPLALGLGSVSSSSQEFAIQDDMVGDDASAERIADLAIQQGGQWHIEIECDMPISVDFKPHDLVTFTDTFIIPGLRTFMVVGVTMTDQGTDEYMTVQMETWAPAPSTDWGGVLDPRAGIPQYGVVGAYSPKAGAGQSVVQLLHGTIMAPNPDGTYEVFVQEEGTVYPSVQVYGQAYDYPLQPRENVVLERQGMVLYII